MTGQKKVTKPKGKWPIKHLNINHMCKPQKQGGEIYAEYSPDYSYRFNICFEHMMDEEDAKRSGKRSKDAGGLTKYGIACGKPGAWLQPLPIVTRIANDTLTLKEAKKHYYYKYYVPYSLDDVQFSDGIAYLVFDIKVNGNKTYTRFVQRGLMELGRNIGTADGLLGSATLYALADLSPAEENQLSSYLLKNAGLPSANAAVGFNKDAGYSLKTTPFVNRYNKRSKFVAGLPPHTLTV